MLLYRSPDLLDWEYVGPLCSGDGDTTGHVWECPNFIAFGERHALIISPIPLGRAIYLSGVYRDHVFHPDGTYELDPGGSLYAPQVMVDAQGRRILFGWLCGETFPRGADRRRLGGCAVSAARPRNGQ